MTAVTNPRGESVPALLARLVAVLAALAAVGWFGVRRPTPRPVAPPVVAEVRPVEPEPEPEPAEPAPPAPTPAPTLDRAALATAEAAVEAARLERARAEEGREVARAALTAATAERTRSASSLRSLAKSVRDPSVRIAAVAARGGLLKVERDKLKADLKALDGLPRPSAKPLVDKSPVARPSDGEEFHFELRRGRVSFIDLERLLDKVKTDARLRLRLSDGRRPISATVGPVGAFSLHYELSRSGVSDLLDGADSYTLTGWELLPEHDRRGEPYELTRNPASEYARAVGRLSPSRSTVTLWVYPDSFALYRTLRDELHARGFLVAGRPLPEAMPIRGSPSGSISAGQ